MDYKKILMGVLGKTLNIANDGELSNLLENANGDSDVSEGEIIKKILAKDVERVEQLKSLDTGKFQEGYAKGKKETLTDFESKIKSKYKIETDTQGVDLIDELVNQKINLVKEKSKMTDEDVKAHPVFQQMESKLLSNIDEVKTTYEEQIENLQNEFKNKQTFNSVTQKAMQIFEGMNPILPSDKGIAQSQKNWFINSLKDYEFSDADGKLVVLKDGKVVQDEHGNTRSFEDVVKSTASSMFEFKKNNGGGNEGGNNGSSASGTDYMNINFKSLGANEAFKQLEQIMSNPEIPMEQKNEIAMKYENAHG